MAEEGHEDHPLAPAKIYGRSDEESGIANPNKIPSPPKSSNKCLVYVLTGIVLQFAVFLMFAIAFLRVESPKVRLNFVSVKDLTYVTTPRPWVNATLVAEVRVRNNNFGAFKFDDGAKAVVLYKNVTLGGGGINIGRARARKVERINVAMEVRSNDSNGLLREIGNFSGEVSLGLVELWSYAKLVGRVKVMRIVNKRKSTELNCTMSLNLKAKVVQDLICF